MAKKSLQDALNSAFDDIPKDSQVTARSIVNRQVPNTMQTSQSESLPNSGNTVIEEEKVNHKVNLNINLDQVGQKETVQVKQENKTAPSTELLTVEKPIKFRDRHKVSAYLVRNDIASEIDKLSKKGGKGFKTRFVNEALLAQLERYGIKLPE